MTVILSPEGTVTGSHDKDAKRIHVINIIYLTLNICLALTDPIGECFHYVLVEASVLGLPVDSSAPFGYGGRVRLPI